MIRYPDAIHQILTISKQFHFPAETVPLMASRGRIIAEDLFSPEEVPSFTNSSMDGFAIQSGSVVHASPSNPVRIPVQGQILAGDRSSFDKAEKLTSTAGVEIMTGAPVPNQFDSVIKIEEVLLSRNSDGLAEWIEVTRPVESGQNLRKKGSDFSKDSILIPKSTRMGSEHILAASSVGVRDVKCHRLPRIAILSTGSELVPPETESLVPGMIRNSTGPFLQSHFQHLGIPVTYLGIIQDDPRYYRTILSDLMKDPYDLVISTGAVSMGQLDFVSDVLKSLDSKIHFHKVAIRPGKPFLFATLPSSSRSSLFLGVPGNPISTAVALRFFVDPLLRAWMNLSPEKTLKATLIDPVEKPQGLRCFFKAKVKVKDETLSVQVLKGQASYVVSSLLDANAWVEFPEEHSRVNAGESVRVYPIHHSFEYGVLS